MYLPSHFTEPRVEVLHEAIRSAGLATLVTAGPDGLDASHVPLLLLDEPGPLGRLVGHVARANPQWRTTPEGSAALAIVLGPDAYVTPSWYPSKRETGRVVPTWNYLAIHVHGTVRFFQERERLLDVVTRLTERHEQGRPLPWKVSDAPPDYLDGMLKGIVGVELTITRIEGKWKASQNRDEPDRRGVEEGLRAEGQQEMADLVRGPRREG
jgi:transcriptional regulator